MAKIILKIQSDDQELSADAQIEVAHLYTEVSSSLVEVMLRALLREATSNPAFSDVKPGK